jgi:Zn-dependent protease
MSDETSQIVQLLAVYAIPVLFAISLHEAAHGYTARYFGDPTAEQMGRLSANPMRHIDWFGTILLPVMLMLSPLHMAFGYAKPVPVDFNRLRNPKKQMGFVAAAGPLANLVMGVGWGVILVLLLAAGVGQPFFLKMAQAGINANAVMCAFNLIPIPPLDGGRIVTALLPMNMARSFARIERGGPLLFVGLILLMNTDLFRGVLLQMVDVVKGIMALALTPFIYLLH